MTNKKPSQAELARALGLTPGRITVLKQKGMPIYSVEAARAWRAQNVAPMPTARAPQAPPAPGDGGAESPTGYEQSRARREAAEAQMAEMKCAELAGALVRMDAVRRVMVEKVTMMRDILLQIPARLGPVLAAETDPGSVMRLLEVEIWKALNDMAQPMEPPVP